MYCGRGKLKVSVPMCQLFVFVEPKVDVALFKNSDDRGVMSDTLELLAARERSLRPLQSFLLVFRNSLIGISILSGFVERSRWSEFGKIASCDFGIKWCILTTCSRLTS